MKTVHEVSALTGVSVRTLHHYDAIGLLKPSKTTAAGYRLYDNAALARLQTILLFRELQFPLREIAAILASPGFDCRAALEQQIDLLRLQQKHLGELIAFARQLQMTGVETMDFSAFDKSEINRYAAEAKEKWGDTAAYREYAGKHSGAAAEDETDTANGLMAIFTAIGSLRALPPDSAAVQEKIATLQQYITDHYYTCTPEMFRCLAQMYTAGDEMTANIDAAGGDGTAALTAAGIAVYLTGK